jgi:hypothetical protein
MMHRQTLEMCKKVLGAKHPDTRTSMNNLALVLDSQGKYDKATILYDKKCAGFAKFLRQEYPHTRTCHENYSKMLVSQRQSRSGSVIDRLNIARNVRKYRQSTLSRVTRKLGFKNSKS